MPASWCTCEAPQIAQVQACSRRSCQSVRPRRDPTRQSPSVSAMFSPTAAGSVQSPPARAGCDRESAAEATTGDKTMLAFGRPPDVVAQKRIDLGCHPVADLGKNAERFGCAQNPPALVERMGILVRHPAHGCTAPHCGSAILPRYRLWVAVRSTGSIAAWDGLSPRGASSSLAARVTNRSRPISVTSRTRPDSVI